MDTYLYRVAIALVSGHPNQDVSYATHLLYLYRMKHLQQPTRNGVSSPTYQSAAAVEALLAALRSDTRAWSVAATAATPAVRLAPAAAAAAVAAGVAALELLAAATLPAGAATIPAAAAAMPAAAAGRALAAPAVALAAGGE